MEHEREQDTRHHGSAGAGVATAAAPLAGPVRFNEQAQDIPHLTVRPKMKGARSLLAPLAAAERERASGVVPQTGQAGDHGDADDADAGADTEAAAAALAGAARKRILEAERQRVINQYRQLKLARMLLQPKTAG